MPIKSNIEFGSGSIYFKCLDEPIPVSEGLATYEEEFADIKEYIKLSQEPIEFTIENAEFPKGWMLTKCRECGYEFPVTNLYNLLYGSSGWLCPKCTFIKRLEEIKKGVIMNHDATHCFNYTTACPKTCYRAQLTEDLKHIIYGLPTSWAYFKYTKECPKWPNKPKEYCDG